MYNVMFLFQLFIWIIWAGTFLILIAINNAPKLFHKPLTPKGGSLWGLGTHTLPNSKTVILSWEREAQSQIAKPWMSWSCVRTTSWLSKENLTCIWMHIHNNGTPKLTILPILKKKITLQNSGSTLVNYFLSEERKKEKHVRDSLEKSRITFPLS